MVPIIILIIMSIFFMFIMVDVFHVITGSDEIDDYPYMKKYRSASELIVAMNRLKKYKLKFQKDISMDTVYSRAYKFKPYEKYFNKDGVYIFGLLDLDKNEYKDYNWIADYFTEYCRVRSKTHRRNPTLHEKWESDKERILQETKEKYGEANNYNLSLYMYADSGLRAPNNYRNTLLAGVIDMYNVKDILDPCSGWGDRLTAAIAKGVNYTGVDPNKCLFEYYEEMIKTFGGKPVENPKKKSISQLDLFYKLGTSDITMYNSGFEIVPIEGVYDLIFTSPPYFELEIYSKDTTQSTSKYRGLNKWFEDFLMFSLKKAWKHLRPGGHMVITINDYGKIKYTRRMVRNVNWFPDSEYLGAMLYGGDFSNIQPMWTWKKLHEELTQEKTLETDVVINIDDCDNISKSDLQKAIDAKLSGVACTIKTPKITQEVLRFKNVGAVIKETKKETP